MSDLSPYQEFLEKAEKEIPRQSVKSSTIKAVGYDADAKTLVIEFTSGSVYRYPDVSAEEHAQFIHAPSIGKHFGQHLRNRKYTKAA